MSSIEHSISPSPPPGCPAHAGGSIGQDFRPFEQHFQNEPWDFWARARKEAPVFFNEELNAFVVTRYDDVAAVLKDAKTFSADNVTDFVTPPSEAAMGTIISAGFVPGPVIVNEDPPEHRDHRVVASLAFTKERIADMEPRVREWTTEYIDRFITSGRADLVRDYMYEIPALVAFHLIGVPRSEVDRVKEFATRRAIFNFGKPTEDEQLELAEGFADFWKWCTGHVDRLWDEPDDSFMSETVELAKQPEYAEILDRTYLYRLCMNLLFAGHETTTNGAANAFAALLTHRDQWERLVADPTLIPNAVDETLRFHSAAPVWRRRTKAATTIAGVDIPADQQILVGFGSANRDEATFPGGETLDVSRENARKHFTFGWGRHKCLGHALAKMELSVAIEQIVERIPHVQLVENESLEYPLNILFRGPEHVRVEWDPAKNPRAEDRPVA